MPFRTVTASRGAGSGQEAAVGVIPIARLAPRGKNGPFGHQEPIGRDAQGGVMMKPAPVATFIMTQAELLFQFLVVAFDDPAVFGAMHEFFQTGIVSEIGKPVFGGLGCAAGPLDQHSLFDEGRPVPAVALCGADASGGEARGQAVAGALAPTHLTPVFGGQGLSQFFERERTARGAAVRAGRRTPRTFPPGGSGRRHTPLYIQKFHP